MGQKGSGTFESCRRAVDLNDGVKMKGNVRRIRHIGAIEKQKHRQKYLGVIIGLLAQDR